MTDKKSQKGEDGVVMRRKIYQQLLDWKEKGMAKWLFLLKEHDA